MFCAQSSPARGRSLARLCSLVRCCILAMCCSLAGWRSLTSEGSKRSGGISCRVLIVFLNCSVMLRAVAQNCQLQSRSFTSPWNEDTFSQVSIWFGKTVQLFLVLYMSFRMVHNKERALEMHFELFFKIRLTLWFVIFNELVFGRSNLIFRVVQ